MNILFLFEETIIPHIGGVQRVTHMLAKELLRRGHNVAFLSTNEDPINCNYNYATKQYYIDFKKNKESIDKEYYNILKKESTNIVINQEPHYNTQYLLSITPKDIKRITCMHVQPFSTQTYAKDIIRYMQRNNFKEWLYVSFVYNFPTYYKRQNRKLEIVRLQKSLENSNYLCLLSTGFIPRILKYMPEIDKKKLFAINNPTESCKFDITKHPKEKIILWVGRQSNISKNIPAFIDIWNILSKKNKDWKAVIIGDGPDMQYNRKYAMKKNVERLEFVGNQEDVIQFYKKSCFIGMTSTHEGWGMVLTEAMSYGCIPFAYDTYESLKDIIDDGKNGIIVMPFDKNEMARRIQEVINDNNRFISMQNAALEKVQSFSIENTVNKWEKLFDL